MKIRNILILGWIFIQSLFVMQCSEKEQLQDIEHDDEIDACLRSAKADLVVVKMLLKDK